MTLRSCYTDARASSLLLLRAASFLACRANESGCDGTSKGPNGAGSKLGLCCSRVKHIGVGGTPWQPACFSVSKCLPEAQLGSTCVDTHALRC
uniref:Putative secreted protein n=1 Tax=Ixodes ricinus TaxID=34613 RepID=A0A6B0UE67_IXORI